MMHYYFQIKVKLHTSSPTLAKLEYLNDKNQYANIPADGVRENVYYFQVVASLLCDLPLYLAVPYYTHTLPYRTIPCHAVPCHAMPCHAMPYHTIPYHTLPYRTIPYRTVPCHAMPNHTIPYRTVLYRTVPCHAMPCRITPYISRMFIS